MKQLVLMILFLLTLAVACSPTPEPTPREAPPVRCNPLFIDGKSSGGELVITIPVGFSSGNIRIEAIDGADASASFSLTRSDVSECAQVLYYTPNTASGRYNIIVKLVSETGELLAQDSATN